MGNVETHEYHQQPGGPGGPGENLRVVILRMIHDVATQIMEEIGRSLEERIQRRTEEMCRVIDERLRRVEAGLKDLEDRGEKRMKRLEERIVELERLGTCSCSDVNMEGTTKFQGNELLEERIATLEQSVHRTLQTVLPRVETLIKHLDSPSTLPPSPLSSSQSLASTKLFSAHLEAACNDSDSKSFQKPYCLEEALKIAIRIGTLDDVRKLLDAGADVNCRSDMGTTPLHWAIKQDQLEVVALLIKRGADINKGNELGRTPLHFAALIDRSRSVKMLLAAGADPDCRDNNGWTALHWAATIESEAVVRELISAGANISVRDNFGMVALDLVGSPAIRKLLK